jgi:hypothetical protein
MGAHVLVFPVFYVNKMIRFCCTRFAPLINI